MYALLGLIGFFGFLTSLITMIIKAKKEQPKKTFLFLLIVCFILFIIALIIRPSSETKTTVSSVTEASALTVTAMSPAVDSPSPTEIPTEIPTATSTPAPTPTPVSTDAPTPVLFPTIPPVSDEQLDKGYLDAWFDDSLMIGDSIAEGLNRYVISQREINPSFLGSMRIVGTSGMMLKYTLAAEKKETTGQVLFRSRFRTISEMVELTQPKRLFLMLGVRDLEWYSPEKLVDVYGEIVSIVKTDHPDLRIYVHSIMPTVKDYAVTAHLDSETRKAANEKLRALCTENSYTYLELSELVCDEEGFLKYEYSGPDYSWHPNDIGKAFWVKLLRSCARDEYYTGIWKPEGINAND